MKSNKVDITDTVTKRAIRERVIKWRCLPKGWTERSHDPSTSNLKVEINLSHLNLLGLLAVATRFYFWASDLSYNIFGGFRNEMMHI